MEKQRIEKQKINCTVCNCKFNDTDTKECLLKQIKVTENVKNSGTRKADESMCGSYQHL